MIKAGLIGCGVIGGALKEVCDLKKIPLPVYDKFKAGMTDFDAILATDLVFVCLPTPTINENQDLSALSETLELLCKNSYEGAVLIRSTVLPGKIDELSEKYPCLRLGHNPEFLTAAKPFSDLITQPAVLIGSKWPGVNGMAETWWKHFDPLVSVMTFESTNVTAMAKYMHNCFLALKVSFFNEMYELCSKFDVSYDEAIAGAVSIGRIGKSHTQVPGPDGSLGYGGMCFVKDTMALLGFSSELGLKGEMLKASVEQNKRVRPEAYDGTEKTGCA